MSNNKQSSIEWLEDKLTGFLTFEDMEAVKNYDNLIEQAKAMHKEEMIEFADNYVDNYVVPNENMAIPTIMDVPQYYNETYGGNK